MPGAVFVDLSADLAAPAGRAGRHPLPEPGRFQAAMRGAGVSSGRPVVVYDDGPGTAAARAWWLLRYFGHPAVSVLDGGLAGWAVSGGPLQTGPGGPLQTGPGGHLDPGDFTVRPGAMPVLTAAGAAALTERGILLDARAPERFRGEEEPVDAVAGHIPGARNRPTTENLDPSGRFLDPNRLRDEFARLGVHDGTAVGAYCGSGVTAAHQVLALELAGHHAALYPGSWSEWITDPARPVATGP